ncbi:YdhK family protein [Terribacillus saccharophilus]|uniref:YdhK family protein n=1 Tax=Terribacillus saccharophilus TaxID=361277 RepID=UPI003D2B25F2
MRILMILLTAVFVLSACGNDESQTQDNQGANDTEHMQHDASGKLPEGLQEADDPEFPPGSKAIIQADHMEGMKGAEATIVGAFDTYAYEVTYTPTNGGKHVDHHRWVIQEELKEANEHPLEPGIEATLEADHMEGMKGATAIVEKVEDTTVYMVDYTSTATGEEVKNHKWLTEEELAQLRE